MSGKRLELLKEDGSQHPRVAVFENSTLRATLVFREIEGCREALGLRLNSGGAKSQ